MIDGMGRQIIQVMCEGPGGTGIYGLDNQGQLWTLSHRTKMWTPYAFTLSESIMRQNRDEARARDAAQQEGR